MVKKEKLKQIAKIFGNVSNLKILLFLFEQEANFYKIKKFCVKCPPSVSNSLKILEKFGLIVYRRKKGKKTIILTNKGKKTVEVIKYLNSII